MLEINVAAGKAPKVYQVLPYNVRQICESETISESTKGIPFCQTTLRSLPYQCHSEFLEKSIEVTGKDKRIKSKMLNEPFDINLNSRSSERCIGKCKSSNLYCYTCCKKSNSCTTCKVSNSQMRVGVPPGCCFLPFCIPSCYKYEHYCSNCGSFLGASKSEQNGK